MLNLDLVILSVVHCAIYQANIFNTSWREAASDHNHSPIMINRWDNTTRTISTSFPFYYPRFCDYKQLVQIWILLSKELDFHWLPVRVLYFSTNLSHLVFFFLFFLSDGFLVANLPDNLYYISTLETADLENFYGLVPFFSKLFSIVSLIT